MEHSVSNIQPPQDYSLNKLLLESSIPTGEDPDCSRENDFYFSCHEKIVSKEVGRKWEKEIKPDFLEHSVKDSVFDSTTNSQLDKRQYSLPNLSRSILSPDEVNDKLQESVPLGLQEYEVSRKIIDSQNQSSVLLEKTTSEGPKFMKYVENINSCSDIQQVQDEQEEVNTPSKTYSNSILTAEMFGTDELLDLPACSTNHVDIEIQRNTPAIF